MSAASPLPHAVSRLRQARLAASTAPLPTHRGFRRERCDGCRLSPSHCLCALRVSVPSRAGVCLVMADVEPLKPSNTGWLVADLVPDTFAFGWARTRTDPALLALLADPQWQPCVVFPGEYVAPERVVTSVPAPGLDAQGRAKRPLFVLLDATWPEARKMFHRSPCLEHLPVLSLNPAQVTAYRLRRSRRDDHFCTSEVAALCLGLAGDTLAEEALGAWLDLFSLHYLSARQQQAIAWDDATHHRWHDLARRCRGQQAGADPPVP